MTYPKSQKGKWKRLNSNKLTQLLFPNEVIMLGRGKKTRPHIIKEEDEREYFFNSLQMLPIGSFF